MTKESFIDYIYYQSSIVFYSQLVSIWHFDKHESNIYLIQKHVSWMILVILILNPSLFVYYRYNFNIF